MPRHLRTAVVLLAAGTVVGLYFASQAYLNPAYEGKLRFDVALAVNLTYYYLWALVAPLVFLVARRVPIERQRWWRAPAAHVAASLLLTSFIVVAAEVVLRLVGIRYDGTFWTFLPLAFALNFHGLWPTYWMLLLGFLSFDFYVKLRDRELRSAQLEGRLSEARLSALKAQLQPHFLFNTLNSISSLMYEDVDAADAMLTRLSDLLRLTIDRDRQVVPLREELELVRSYLAIERIRFGDRLKVDYDVDPASRECLVPSFVLQPVVENAIRHSIARQERGGKIRISSRCESNVVELFVEDDGPGLPDGGVAHRGVGLRNTEARLAQLYGARSTLDVSNRRGGGVEARIVIPVEGEPT